MTTLGKARGAILPRRSPLTVQFFTNGGVTPKRLIGITGADIQKRVALVRCEHFGNHPILPNLLGRRFRY
jgi:hypothetical protein